MDLSAGAVVMLSAMFGAKMVYLYGIGLIPFALIVVGAGIVLGTISGTALVGMIESYMEYYNNRRLQRNLGVLTPMEKHEQYILAA